MLRDTRLAVLADSLRSRSPPSGAGRRTVLGGRRSLEGDDRGSQYRGFGDVIMLSLDGRAFPLGDAQRHLIDDDPVPVVGCNFVFQLVPRVPAGVFDQFGVASHLAVACGPARLAAGARVIMSRAEGDAEDQRGNCVRRSLRYVLIWLICR